MRMDLRTHEVRGRRQGFIESCCGIPPHFGGYGNRGIAISPGSALFRYAYHLGPQVAPISKRRGGFDLPDAWGIHLARGSNREKFE